MIKLLRTFNGGPGLNASPLAHDGRSALIVTADLIETRNVETGEAVASYPAVRARLFPGPKDGLIVSIYTKGSTRIKDLISGKTICDICGEPITMIRMSADRSCLGIGRSRFTGFDGEYYSSYTAEFWNLAEDVAYWFKEGSGDSGGALTDMEVSDDGRFAAVTSFASLFPISLKDGRTIGKWRTSARSPGDLVFTRDSRFLLVNNRHAIDIIDLASQQIRQFAAPPAGKSFNSLAVSPDEAQVLAGGEGWFGLWEFGSGRLIWERQFAFGHVQLGWFLAESGLIAVTPVFGKIELISNKDGAAIDSIKAHVRPVTAVAETSGGRHFLTTDAREIKVWELSDAV